MASATTRAGYGTGAGHVRTWTWEEVIPLGKVRTLNIKYGISKHRFKELYYWCLQYNEWKDELKYKTDTVKAIETHDMPTGSGGMRRPTEELAMRRARLEENCRLIEQTAIETDPDLYQYILKAVTNEDITYRYLRLIMEIPCSSNTYYNRRRKFYWLLNVKK